jgi:hypothetical protein
MEKAVPNRAEPQKDTLWKGRYRRVLSSVICNSPGRLRSLDLRGSFTFSRTGQSDHVRVVTPDLPNTALARQTLLNFATTLELRSNQSARYRPDRPPRPHVNRPMGAKFVCARRSWRDPAGGSPVREGGSARPVASVAGSSATMVAKRTQRDDEDCIELRKTLTVEAEALRTAAGNMCGTVLRGTAAPLGSETSSSRQGSCRNLGDLRPPAAAKAAPGQFGKARSRSQTGRSEESDGCIVPMKPRTTSADGLMAESVEGRRPV